MKKFVKVVCALLLAVLALSMVACSSYGKLQKAFEKEGYTVSANIEEFGKNIKEELKKQGVEDTVTDMHVLTKGMSVVMILEFKATDDMVEYYKNSNTAQGVIKDIKKDGSVQEFYDALANAGYANGNCFVIPLNILYVNEVTTIVKNA